MDRLVASTQFLSLMVVGVVAGTFVGTQIGQVRAQTGWAHGTSRW